MNILSVFLHNYSKMLLSTNQTFITSAVHSDQVSQEGNHLHQHEQAPRV